MAESLKAHLHLDHIPRLLRRSQNTVYEAIFDDNTPCIIRVTDSQHRSRTAIAEEIRALNRLSQKCNFICKPLRGPENRFIEELTIENEIKYISFFEQAKGQYPDFHLEADAARAATCLAQFHQQSAALQHAYKRRQADRPNTFRRATQQTAGPSRINRYELKQDAEMEKDIRDPKFG